MADARVASQGYLDSYDDPPQSCERGCSDVAAVPCAQVACDSAERNERRA
jgi:hypothetical protein